MIVATAAFALSMMACPEPSHVMMALSLDDFDQTDQGWRSLDDEGCEVAAADAIARYRLENVDTLLVQDIGTLIWHEAQLRAAAGQTDRAVDLMRQSRETEAEPVIQHYIDGTLAFLLRDEPGLLDARARMVAEPVPDGFAGAVERFRASYPDFPPPVWPLNLDAIDGLIACFDKPYAEAYACRPEVVE